MDFCYLTLCYITLLTLLVVVDEVEVFPKGKKRKKKKRRHVIRKDWERFTKTEFSTKAVFLKSFVTFPLSQRDSIGENAAEEELEAHVALISIKQKPH